MGSLIIIGILSLFFFWLLCGSINICIYTLTDGYQSQLDKKWEIGLGPLLLVFIIGYAIFSYPVRWAAILGCRMATLIEGVFKK